ERDCARSFRRRRRAPPRDDVIRAREFPIRRDYYDRNAAGDAAAHGVPGAATSLVVRFVLALEPVEILLHEVAPDVFDVRFRETFRDWTGYAAVADLRAIELSYGSDAKAC